MFPPGQKDETDYPYQKTNQRAQNSGVMLEAPIPATQISEIESEKHRNGQTKSRHNQNQSAPAACSSFPSLRHRPGASSRQRAVLFPRSPAAFPHPKADKHPGASGFDLAWCYR